MALPQNGAAARLMLPQDEDQKRLALGMALARRPETAAQIFAAMGITPEQFVQMAQNGTNDASPEPSQAIINWSMSGQDPNFYGPRLNDLSTGAGVDNTADAYKTAQARDFLAKPITSPMQQGLPPAIQTLIPQAGPGRVVGSGSSPVGVPGSSPVGGASPIGGGSPTGIPGSAPIGGTTDTRAALNNALMQALSGAGVEGQVLPASAQPDVPPNAANVKLDDAIPPAPTKPGDGVSWLKAQIDKRKPGKKSPPVSASEATAPQPPVQTLTPEQEKQKQDLETGPLMQWLFGGGNEEPTKPVPPAPGPRTESSVDVGTALRGGMSAAIGNPGGGVGDKSGLFSGAAAGVQNPDLASALNDILNGVTMPASPEPQRIGTPSAPQGRPMQSGGLAELLAASTPKPAATPQRVLPATLLAAIMGR